MIMETEKIKVFYELKIKNIFYYLENKILIQFI